MNYKILPNGNLLITADSNERQSLREQVAHVPDSCHIESDALESLIANSELDWIPEGTTGDLTSAPMLGILGEPTPGGNGPLGAVLVGRWEDPTGTVQVYFCPVVARWAYMRYEVRSFVDDLIETGECRWQGGFAEPQITKSEQ